MKASDGVFQRLQPSRANEGHAAQAQDEQARIVMGAGKRTLETLDRAEKNRRIDCVDHDIVQQAIEAEMGKIVLQLFFGYLADVHTDSYAPPEMQRRQDDADIDCHH